jgi:hypothetical protein
MLTQIEADRKSGSSPSGTRPLGPCALAAFSLGLLSPAFAHAAFLHGEALDTAADVLTWIVLIIVPITAIVLFWLVHILPEKIAEKKHHPQADAIKTLCLLSLVFGGILWPLAWIWAYTKPVLYKMAYGTDKHEDYFLESPGRKAEDPIELKNELERLRKRVDALAGPQRSPIELDAIRSELVGLESRLSEPRSRGKPG